MSWPRHYLLSFGGSFWTEEIWQMGLRLSHGATADLFTDGAMKGFAEDHLADCVTAVSAWWGTANVGASRKAILNWVKFNAIDHEGHYMDTENTNVETLASPITPPAFSPLGTETIPQASLVLSLRTDANRGPSSHGRVYLPPQQYVYGTGPRIDSTARTNIGTAFKNFLVDLNNWPGIDPPDAPNVCVVSPVGLGSAKVVTNIKVGDMYDTHQSRRRKIKETYLTVTL